MMKQKELKDKSISQLKQIEQTLLEEQRQIRFSRVLSNVSNPARIRTVRRDIARVKTMIRQIELRG